MPTLFFIARVIFALIVLSGLSVMANYFFKKSYGSGQYHLCGVLSITGILFFGLLFVTRAYARFSDAAERAAKIVGFGRMGFILFLMLLSVLSYYMYLNAFAKRRYQKQQNVVLLLAALALVLACLPQNDYAKSSPGMLMPVLRSIPSMLLGIYVALILFADGYDKNHAGFQRYAGLLALTQIVHFVYAFFLKAEDRSEYVIFTIVAVIFLLMMRIWYRELVRKNPYDRY